MPFSGMITRIESPKPSRYALDFLTPPQNNQVAVRVVIEHLNKSFSGPNGERIAALQDFNLTVEAGELMTILGPSGCGKTTALRLVAGLDSPDSGTVAFDGQVVNRVPPKDRDVALVFQSPALYPHLSAHDNMAFGLTVRRLPKAEISRRVKEAAEWLGLLDCLERLPHALSSGERQRVALGRAVVRQPKVLMFDEPLSNLDAPLRGQMRAEIARLQARLAVTVLYVTHDQVEALTLGGRVAVMNAGALQQVGPPRQVYQHPANLFIARFVGSHPMNLFRGALLREDDTLVFQEEPEKEGALPKGLRLRIPQELAARVNPHVGRKLVLGLRSEDLAVTLPAPTNPQDGTAVGTVETVESVGAETYWRVSRGSGSLVVRAPAMQPAVAGEQVRLTLDLRRAHFFDPETQRAIQ